MITHVIASGEPKPGMEFEYHLAWWHRQQYCKLYQRTPCWQFKKKRRRHDAWMRAITRVHKYGRDRIVYA